MQRIIITFGLIAGAILAAMMLITLPFHETLLETGGGEIIGYSTMVAAFLLVFFGVRSYRDNVAGGSVSFGRAFGVGIAIVAVASACYVLTWEVIYFSGTRGTQYVASYQAKQLEKVRASGASQAEIDKKTAEMKKFAEMYQNPVINSAMTFLEPLPVGLIIALVSAAILRRRPVAGMAAATG